MTGCNLTYVPCNDEVGCYSIEHLCDGIKQCIDGTDEVREKTGEKKVGEGKI